MKRYLTLLGAVAIVAALASTVALANHQAFDTPNMPHVGLKNIYDRTTILQPHDGLVQLPRPVGNNRPYVNKPVPGPMVTGVENPDVAGAFAEPRGGGSMYSETQQADREIRKLIRHLD